MGSGFARLQRAESGQERLAVLRHHDGAVFQRRPGGGQGASQLLVRRPAVGGEPPQPCGLCAQSCRCAARDDPGKRAVLAQPRAGHGCRRGGRSVDGCLLDDDVGVGPADAERGDTGPPDRAGLGPGGALRGQAYRSGGPVHLGRRFVDVERGRHEAVPDGQYRLDDARDTRCGLRVADVGLERAEQQRPVFGPVLTVRRQQRFRLDGVAQCGSGAVGLQHVHVGGAEPGAGPGVPYDLLLGEPVGRGEAVGRAVLVDRGATYDREHTVAVAACVGEPLDQQHPGTFREAGPVGGAGEGLAAAVERQPLLAGHLGEDARCRQHGGAACEGQRALAAPQRRHGQVERHQ